MLTNSHITTILPVVQMDRARRFYEEKLGLMPVGGHADGSFVMRCSDGGTVSLLPKPEGTKAQHTALSFEVANLDQEIRDLEGRGVKFEDYDMPDFKTVNHVFTTADERCAWFTDTEGNILCIHEELGKPH
jgi:predicted enzyme related to lactoylglutathione lyase